MRALVSRRGAGGGGVRPYSTTLAAAPVPDPRPLGSGNADDTGLAGSPRPRRAARLVVVGAVVVAVSVVASVGQVWAQKGDAQAGKVGAAQVGPDLSQIAKIQTPEYIMGKILNPAALGTVAGYPKGVMPPMFGQTLTAKEYVDLVAFLLTLK